MGGWCCCRCRCRRSRGEASDVGLMWGAPFQPNCSGRQAGGSSSWLAGAERSAARVWWCDVTIVACSGWFSPGCSPWGGGGMAEAWSRGKASRRLAAAWALLGVHCFGLDTRLDPVRLSVVMVGRSVGSGHCSRSALPFVVVVSACTPVSLAFPHITPPPASLLSLLSPHLLSVPPLVHASSRSAAWGA